MTTPQKTENRNYPSFFTALKSTKNTCYLQLLTNYLMQVLTTGNFVMVTTAASTTRV